MALPRDRFGSRQRTAPGAVFHGLTGGMALPAAPEAVCKVAIIYCTVATCWQYLIIYFLNIYCCSGSRCIGAPNRAASAVEWAGPCKIHVKEAKRAAADICMSQWRRTSACHSGTQDPQCCEPARGQCAKNTPGWSIMRGGGHLPA